MDFSKDELLLIHAALEDSLDNWRKVHRLAHRELDHENVKASEDEIDATKRLMERIEKGE